MIAIIDYGLGNLTSVANALEFMNIDFKITNKIEDIKKADKLILPGVGAFKYGMKNLQELGLIDVLNEEVLLKKKEILGICLGMQLMCKKSYEGGEHKGLGWINAEVLRFDFNGEKLRIPHVGWNDVKCNTNSLLFKGGRETQTFYFVHSYYLKPAEPSLVIGTCNYGFDFCAVIKKENILAVQFHPEKSQHEGLNLLKHFSEL